MKNTLSISKSDIQFLKIIFKACGIFGILPLETYPSFRNMQSILYLIFNMIGIICKIIGFLKFSEKFKMEAQEIVVVVPTYGSFILLNILCIYGIFRKNESWIKFFNILDKLSIGIIIKTKLVQNTIIIISIFFLTIFILILQFLALEKVTPLTLNEVMGSFLWTSAFMNSYGITLVIWLISKVLSTRYAHLCNLIKATFIMQRFEITIFSNKLVKIKRSVYFLNKAVILLNNLIGKTLFLVFLAAFLYLIAAFNIMIFIFKSDKIYEWLEVYIPNILLSLQLTVSKTKYL